MKSVFANATVAAAFMIILGAPPPGISVTSAVYVPLSDLIWSPGATFNPLRSSPKFISVNLFGRVENPGVIKLPLEASLSDAIDLSGPIKPLSGKIVLIRYNKDIVPNEPLADRLNPDMVKAFKENPYTQSLKSWA